MFAVRSRRRHRSPARYLRHMSSQSRQFATTIANGQRIPLLVNALARGNDIYVRIRPRTTQVITEVTASRLHPVNHVLEGRSISISVIWHSIRVPLLISARTKQRRSPLLIAVSLLRSLRRVRDRRMSLRRPRSSSLPRASTSIISSEVLGGKV